jgi:hypothetical protein
MKVSIVIVSWNVKSYLIDCIESILRYPAACTVEIIVVDNASTDGTAEAVREKFPSVCVIANAENTGFARANNQGAAAATGEYLFILNPDTLLPADTLDTLVAFMDRAPDIAMCGPRVLNDDRTIQRSVRGFPTWSAAFGRYTILKYLGLFKASLERWRCRRFDYNTQADVEQLIGAALLIRRTVFERLGGFDERFFMYYEEVDLCRRLKEQGLRVVYTPCAELIHLGGKSAKQIPAKKRFMTLESLLQYLEKHTSPGKSKMLSILFKAGVLFLQLYELTVFGVAHAFCRMTGSAARADKCAVRYKSAMEFLATYYLEFLWGRR